MTLRNHSAGWNGFQSYKIVTDKLISAFSSAWKRSFDYTGRSDRGDYWWFVLASFILLLVLNIVGSFGAVHRFAVQPLSDC